MKKYLEPLLLKKTILNEFKNVNINTEYKSSILDETQTETLMLVPSERCNLHCKYCYEISKNPLRMDIETAKSTIEKAFSELENWKRLKIEFRGGEPFLEFDFMKEVCEWVIENYKDRNFFFYAVTNGTCFSDEAKTWLTRHKDIFVAPLSIDGNKNTQNSNRSNSFDLIDFDFILRTWINAYTYTTILPENAKSVFEDLLFLIESGFTIRANFEFAQLWTDKQLGDLSIGLKRLADYVLENNLHNRLNLFSRYGFLDYDLKDCIADRRFFVPCNAGKHRKIVAADGRVYPCHTLVPSSFNHYGDEYAEQLFEKLKTEEINSDECCKCKFFHLCYICVGFSYSYTKDFRWRNKSFCDITRIRTFTAAYYWGKRLSVRQKNLSDDKKMLARKIVDLYDGEKVYE